jgi:hypothetical protein
VDFEATITAWLLGLAVLPLAWQLRQSRHSGAAWGVIIVWLFAATAFTWYARGYRPVPVEGTEASDRPIQVSTPGYSTSDTCRSCHPSAYHSWHQSYHRSMTQLPGADSVLGDFNQKSVQIQNHRFELSREGEDFWVEQDLIRPWSPSGFPTPRTKSKIKMLTGSHHMQVYWTSTGESRKIEQMPIVHLVEADRWVPRDSVFLMPHRSMGTEAGRWNTTCVKCHSTFGEENVASLFDMDTRVAEFGIACEECHGPAADHIAANRDPQRRYQTHLANNGDPTIVNPARLPAKRQSFVCGQCHGVHHDRKDGKHNRFQPGDDLFALTPIVHLDNEETIAQYRADRGDTYVNGKFWPDGMLRVAGRELNGIVRSPCYTHGDESRGIMSCLDCHSSHQYANDPRPVKTWANDQLKPNAIGNAACIKCHPKFSDPKSAAKHTRHPTDSAGALCYNCHMPHSSYGLLNAIRSHTLDSPNVTVTRDTGRPNACNQCHLDKTLSWTASHLNDWFGQPIPKLGKAESSTAESVLRLTAGDAAQRALAAWHMGWQPALEASGNHWQAPFLALLLDDDYDAVRYIAQRTLRRLPGFADLNYDYIGDDRHRSAAVLSAREQWKKQADSNLRFDPAILIDGTLNLDDERLKRLLEQRDDKTIVIAE